MENEDLELNEDIQQLEELWDWFNKKKQDRLIKKHPHPANKPPTDLAKSVQKIKPASPTYSKSDIEEPVDDVTGNLNNLMKRYKVILDQMLKAIPTLKKKAKKFHAILPPIVQQKKELPLVKPELAQESLKEQLERIFNK
jgi:hypothetical protein